ncbi:MAG: VOC family protein [Thermomicrobiales bacterium]
MSAHTDKGDAQLEREGYIDLDGTTNTARLRQHQAYLVGLGIPGEVASTLDHIGVQAATAPAFERLLERYKQSARGADVVNRGDRRIAMIDRGTGLYRVELFEPRAGQPAPRPGFVHYAFIWPDWKPREGELRDLVELARTSNLNGNWLAFLATPDGYEAEIVSEPVAFT